MSLLNLLEKFTMFEKIRKMKNKKGFTLVELIVVLVILAILAALLVPALTGYIEKANKEKVISECRMVVMAAQTETESFYASLTSNAATTTAADIAAKLNTDAEKTTIANLAEVKGHWTVTVNAKGKIAKVVYCNSGWVCTYLAEDETVGETTTSAGYNVVAGNAPTSNSVVGK